MLITFVGMPAAGKSTMGKCLAQELQYQFIDLDLAVEQKTGTTIALLFQRVGEQAFREIEREVLLAHLHHQNTVLATGGGTPCFQDNMQHITDNSLCIYILADLRKITQRVSFPNDLSRPMFAGFTKEEEVHQYLEQLYEQRHTCYAQAHVFLLPS